uniref:Protein kinase domain-containing protein n=1 Tax=Meloidogyne incognita TaxID=6306 RepID=A0A914L0H6_MELIC
MSFHTSIIFGHTKIYLWSYLPEPYTALIAHIFSEELFLHCGEKDGKLLIALELGGKDLRNYYERDPKYGRRHPRSNEKFLTKIIKGAARAIAQFHQYGGHGDIKHENFVVSRDHKRNADVIDVKLIDFNESHLYDPNYIASVEGIQTEDIKKFGEMVYILFNEKYDQTIPELHEINFDNDSKLDRVIKACFQDENRRPNIQEIVEFLNGKIKMFEYERTRPPQQQEHYETQHYVERDDSPPPRHSKFYCFGC